RAAGDDLALGRRVDVVADPEGDGQRGHDAAARLAGGQLVRGHDVLPVALVNQRRAARQQEQVLGGLRRRRRVAAREHRHETGVGDGEAHVAGVTLGGEQVQLVVGLRDVNAPVRLGVDDAVDVVAPADARVDVQVVVGSADAAALGGKVDVDALDVRDVGGASVPVRRGEAVAVKDRAAAPGQRHVGGVRGTVLGAPGSRVLVGGE